ncbi:MAG: protein-serine/threonine phosphatase [Proteobacteria bacterium]|nr:protein-serine/threonine phosphatase [Pseudomonadota bacterium]
MFASSLGVSRKYSRPSALDLCISMPCVTPETDNATVLQLFGKHNDLVSLPVVENDRPFGLINRHIFLSQMAKPYHRELYDKKSCIAFMDKTPLVIDAATSIEALAEQAVASGDKALADGFIITQEGRYLGLGFGLDLIRGVSDMHARQHQQIMQSIEYASVIQHAMLGTSRQALANTLADYCLVWEPRDSVGGDCYHFVAHERGWLAVVVDCTGHGVPGAFMTLIFSSVLERALALHGPENPAVLLQEINRRIKHTLGQIAGQEKISKSNDGCDAVLIAVDTVASKLTWASARTPIFRFSAATGQAEQLESDRMGAGYTDTPCDYVWSNHEIPLIPGDLILVCTDGLIDQVGGIRQIAYGKRRLQELLQRCHAMSMQELATELLQEHRAYQDDQARRDDLTFFGFRI